MKVGMLTFHYSNNYGGVLQSFALYKQLKELNYDVEIINYIPQSYKPNTLINIILESKSKNLKEFLDAIVIKLKNNRKVIKEFDAFREANMNLSEKVDEISISNIINNYDMIIVGSDQIWNPSQRVKKEYFLDFKEQFSGKKISYAADSTIDKISEQESILLKASLDEFNLISVRNQHSYNFVKQLVKKNIEIVCDPTILYNFNNMIKEVEKPKEYILTYILGDEIEGSHSVAIKKIKNKYGNIPVYSIGIPTMKFKINTFADKVYYDLTPEEWVNMIRNAKFIYTDSFHGVLFSMKFKKQFLAYYKEELRATRFIDLNKRYKVEKYIISNVDEIEMKGSLEKIDYSVIDNLINEHKERSIEYLRGIKKL